MATDKSGTSRIAHDTTITGTVRSNGALLVEGSISGPVEAKDMVIAAGAVVRGDVVSDRITIAGRYRGSLHADVIDINASAEVCGQLRYETLGIQSGAKLAISVTAQAKDRLPSG